MHRFVLGIVVAALLAAPGLPEAQGEPGGESPFGMHFNPPPTLRGRPADLEAYIRDLAFPWVRSSVFVWGNMEPRKGTFAFAKFDPLIDLLRKQGVAILATLHPASSWGIDNELGFKTYADKVEKYTGKRPSGPPRGTVFGGPPRNWEDWYDFVFATVTHYKIKGIRFWQIANEQDSPGYWWGTAEEYVKLLEVSARAVKAADPGATIVLGGWTSEGISRIREGHPYAPVISNFIHRVMKEGAPYFDIVDMHIYGDYLDIPEKVEWMSDAMKKYGYRKPIWTTELGGPDDRVTAFTEEKQQQEVIKRHALAFASGIARIFYFTLFNVPTKSGQPQTYRNLGLIDDETFRKKPAYDTYQLMMAKLGGFSRLEQLDFSPPTFAFRFTTPSKDVFVVWSEEDMVINLAPYVRAPTVTVTDVDGNAAEATPARMDIGSSPVFVEAAATPQPLSWDKCIQNPLSRILESLPRQCQFPDGRRVVEPSDSPPPAPSGAPQAGIIPPDTDLIFSDGFESGSVSAGWTGFAIHPDTTPPEDSDSIDIVTAPVRAGRYVLKVTVHPEDAVHKGDVIADKERAELLRMNRCRNARCTSGDEAKEGTEMWYAWSVYLPDDYTYSPSRGKDFQVMGQWHDWSVPGEAPGRNPIIAVNYVSSGEVHGFRIWYAASPGEKRQSFQTPIELGRWIDLVFHIRWSQGADGFLEVWKDGQALTSNGRDTRITGPNMFNAHPNYLRLGLYRGKNQEQVNTIYYDEVKIWMTRKSDQSSQRASCDAHHPCPQGADCYQFPDEAQPLCWAGDPCVKCPSKRCVVAESYPMRVVCR